MEAQPEERRSLWVVDAQGEDQVPYGAYKEYANAIYAGLGGDEIADTVLYFGSIEDLRTGTASTLGDEIYDAIAEETAFGTDPRRIRSTCPKGRSRSWSGRPATSWSSCPRCSTTRRSRTRRSCPRAARTSACRSGRVPCTSSPRSATRPWMRMGLAAAEQAAVGARAFAAIPPGPLANIGNTLLVTLRLALLFGLPGFLYYRRFRDRSWPRRWP